MRTTMLVRRSAKMVKRVPRVYYDTYSEHESASATRESVMQRNNSTHGGMEAQEATCEVWMQKSLE